MKYFHQNGFFFVRTTEFEDLSEELKQYARSELRKGLTPEGLEELDRELSRRSDLRSERCKQCGGALAFRVRAKRGAEKSDTPFIGCMQWPACCWTRPYPKLREDLEFYFDSTSYGYRGANVTTFVGLIADVSSPLEAYARACFDAKREPPQNRNVFPEGYIRMETNDSFGFVSERTGYAHFDKSWTEQDAIAEAWRLYDEE